MEEEKEIKIKERGFDPKEEEFINKIAGRILPNLEIHFDSRMKEFKNLFDDIHDSKFNIATLSSLLSRKGFFTEEEFRECFSFIVRSFGIVKSDGTMDGKVVVTDFNFNK